jgi:hypothetical protein
MRSVMTDYEGPHHTHKARQAATCKYNGLCLPFLHPDYDLSNIMPPRQRAVSRTVGGDCTQPLQVAGQEHAAQTDTGKI